MPKAAKYKHRHWLIG